MLHKRGNQLQTNSSTFLYRLQLKFGLLNFSLYTRKDVVCCIVESCYDPYYYQYNFVA